MSRIVSSMCDLEEIVVEEFNLELTLNCGQVFHWQRLNQGYAGVIGARPVYVEQRGNLLLTSRGATDAVSRYFSLDHPLPEIYASFPDDPTMRAALDGCRGLRIIRQPLWECLATFITSALKQVAHITSISHRLRQQFGQTAGTVGGLPLFTYPTSERIAGLQEADLRACGLGFRAVSLLATARQLQTAHGGGTQFLDAMRSLDRPETLAALTAFRGVGTKVANCVLLFGYEHLDAFPIDVWIERVIRETYFQARPAVPLPTLQRFCEEYFGPYGGYAQQYLFHHARTNRSRTRPPGKGIEAPGMSAPLRRVQTGGRRNRRTN